MNKYKKIAMAVASTVMAGAMLVPLAACNKKPTGLGTVTGSNQTQLTPSTDENGKLTWAAGTNVILAVGHNKNTLGTAYHKDSIDKLQSYVGGTTSAKLYGTDYSSGDFKPAWKALAEQLNVTFTDKYTGKKSEAQLDELKKLEGGGLAAVDVFTSSASDLNNEASRDSEAVLDITKYLDYMPNYKAFLEANPITRLSLTAGSDGSMYLLPYFDGNDDIEKFVLLRKDIVEDLLNATEEPTGTISFKTQAQAKSAHGAVATEASAASFMGTTGTWNIDVTDPSALDATADAANDWGNDAYKTKEGQDAKTIKITVSYTDALANAKSAEAGSMGAILKAAGVADADINAQTSGNIVDIMNLAINKTAGEVTGKTLIQLLRKYIEVAYKYNNESFYTTGGRKLADVFNSAYAAWDVDLYTALGRCFVTSGTMLGGKVKTGAGDLFLITGRENKMSRFNDVVALAGELFGVRGMYGLYQYTYIGDDGNMLDGRTNADMFDALNRMNKLTKEGLFMPKPTANITGNYASGNVTENKGAQTLSLRDYVQTQTAKIGFTAEQEGEANNDYNFAPVYTPVSKWDVDGKDSNGHEKIMRFTESWRTVKTTGFGISYKAVKDNPDKLAACLALVDYMFSNDGQILMTYGPQAAANDNGTVTAATTEGNGFWYGTEVTDPNVSLTDKKLFNKVADETNYAPAQYESLSSKYFVYNGKVYTGTYYNGRQIPTMTASSKAMFLSSKLGATSFTDYARLYIGTTLPIGNKDQGFEYQCTAKCGLRGSDIVNIGLNNGTIEHVVQQIPGTKGNKLSNWYSIVPTTLFYESDILSDLTAGTQTYNFQYLTGFNAEATNNLFTKTDGDVDFTNDIMAYGLGSDKPISKLNTVNLPADAAACVTLLDGYGMGKFQEYMNEAWKDLLSTYGINI